MTRGGQEHQLRDFWEGKTTLVLFLRHFGCIGCSENMAELAPRFPELRDLGVHVLLVGNGAPHFIEGFVERFSLVYQHVQVVSDPSLQVHRHAGLLYSGWGVFGFRGLRDMLRAFSRGHMHGSNQGSNFQQGGTLLLDDAGVVRFFHRNPSIGGYAHSTEWMQAILQNKLEKRALLESEQQGGATQ